MKKLLFTDFLQKTLGKHLCGSLKILALCGVSFWGDSLSAGDQTDFNEGWSFQRYGELPDGRFREEVRGLDEPSFDDSNWRHLNLPHDWGIEGPFRADLPNRTGSLPWAGIGWYRKSFSLPANTDKDSRIFVHFDGAMSETELWLNGHRIGEWKYGYTSFRMELTEYINWDGDNLVAVRLNNRENSSRWYPGGGIYRNVALEISDPVSVAHWGVFVSTPEVSDSGARIKLEAKIENKTRGYAKDVSVNTKIYYIGIGGGTENELVAEIVTPVRDITRNWHAKFDFQTNIKKPHLWSPDSTHLYLAVVNVTVGGEIRDSYKTTFGIRDVTFSSTEGCRINGERVQFKGVCMHHDLGPLGTAVNLRALERQLELLKEMGCNAIRTSHNPPTPELLDLCDRMGFMVIVEAFDCWAGSKTENDYGRFFNDWYERDIESMVKRDRNHPSVIMWSSGNEIREQGTVSGHEVSRLLTETIKSYDPTRLVTAGCNNPKSGINGFQETVDVFGYNYKPHLYGTIHESNPSIPLYGSETASTISSRGEYFFPVSEAGPEGYRDFQVSSYDIYYPRWASTADTEFRGQDENPFIMGEFVWTGFDYLGEPTPYNPDATNALNLQNTEDAKKLLKEFEKLSKNAPSRSSYFGILDLCGFKKDRFYLYQSRWRPDLPVAHILPHWNWPDRVGKITPVHVYTSGDEAELFLNGQSLGRKNKEEFEYRISWDDVVYEPGKLCVQTYLNGEVWAESTVETTGEAYTVELSADRTLIKGNGQDLSFVTVKIVDEKGRLVPRSQNFVEFSVSGPAEIVAVGNGNAASHESFTASERKAYNGKCLVVLRSESGNSGRVVLKARSKGLKGSKEIILVVDQASSLGGVAL